MKPIRIITMAAVSALLMLASSCSTSRKGATSANVGHDALESRYRALESTQTAWTDVDVPFSFSLTKPTDFAISGRMKMVSGRCVDISVRLLGIEMARLMVTTDSVYATYKLKKLYVAEPIAGMGDNMPRLLSNLQDLLLGRVFVVGRDVSGDKGPLPPFSSFDASETDDGHMALSTSLLGTDVKYAFFVDGENHVSSTEVLSSITQKAMVTYTGVQSTAAGTMPRRDNIQVAAGKTNIDATIDWRWSSAKWNTGLTLDVPSPRGYKRVTVKELMNELMGL